MHSTVIKPKSHVLRKYIEYFLLLKNNGKNSFYATYPNHNLCLAVYKNSFFEWGKTKSKDNQAKIFESKVHFQSSLIGHHNKACQIKVSGNLDGICIIFKMSAIRQLSAVSFQELMNQEQVFERIFGKNAVFFLERVFQVQDDTQRCLMLENFLLPKFENTIQKTYLHKALDLIYQNSEIRVEDLAKYFSVSRTKIFRDFKQYIGQSPKTFIETVRFRKAIETLKSPQNINSLTELSYALGYADQSHFIKDFSKMAGTSPSKFTSKIEVVNEDFIWTK